MKISCFIACKNHGAYVEKAINSVLMQTHPPDQLILIDDGSDDNSLEVMQKFPDAELRIHEISKGNIASYNEGIMASKHEVIHLMAADDFLISDHIYSACLDMLEKPNVGFVTIGIQHVNSEGKMIRGSVIPPFNGVANPVEVLNKMRNIGNFVNGGGTLVKSEAQRVAGPYDSDLPYTADFLNWIKISGLGWYSAYIQAPIYAYRRHQGSMTHTGSAPVEERQRCAEALDAAIRNIRHVSPPYIK